MAHRQVKPVRTLYLCYFGLREPLVQTQVLPYLRQLVTAGVDVNLLTFEPRMHRTWTERELVDERTRLAGEGIRWFCLPYHKWPSLPATLYDILAGAFVAARLVRRHRIEVLHARSHMPLAMALPIKRWTGCRLVFDLRGLMANEYADAGSWKEKSLVFRAVKGLERAGIRSADQIVVLTWRMREWLVAERLTGAEKVEVIPCCVDFSRFCNGNKKKIIAPPTPERFEVVYAGSVAGLSLLEEMGRFFLELRSRQPSAFLRILTTSSRSDTTARLQHVGLDSNDFRIGAARPAEV